MFLTLTKNWQKQLQKSLILYHALDDKTIKSILICTSTPTHIKFIKEAAKRKKIIFCEKPLDLNLEKVNDCKKYIKKFNPKIQMGFNRRYDPGHRSLKINLDNGKIGTLVQSLEI